MVAGRARTGKKEHPSTIGTTLRSLRYQLYAPGEGGVFHGRKSRVDRGRIHVDRQWVKGSRNVKCVNRALQPFEAILKILQERPVRVRKNNGVFVARSF